ncbi:sugar transferase [Deinococcus radiopugnans]|uniref:Lipopolysaccharide/colanic/teichoic acid biosynthesis glycosyltransferase n=1 Tax=Deinococcus radiopugnans ATCC 19172 TaxID=585398 RepID=A0ABR6NUP5_9DEIO|nr:sugar transferase [Deinococcus radiopugnans]MBB6017763.1 lipopolysaccharide/colanic/teichoic acid biosynthesis glycosyltransferase [Deinococcus radiopugnans ATCC 19172]
MRILLITQWFDPEPSFKGLLFAQELRRQGHQVEVLTGFPNYPGGKVYPGYRVRPFQREIMDGIPILRVPLYPSHDGSGVKRALNYLSFAAAASIGTLFVSRPDVAYVYHPPATVSLPAMVLQALRRVPFVYDIQDLWPDTLAATGMMENAAVLKGVGGWMNQVYRQAAHITVLSEGFKERLQQRGVPENKLSVIPNWTDEGQIDLAAPDPARARELGFEGRFNVVFAGTMGKAQALDTVLEAAELLQISQPTARFVMIGGGVEVERLQAQTLERQLSNVVFLPRRPPSEIGEILNLADALLVHLKDDPLFSITIPSKTQAYLMVGKPILMGVRGDAAQMVEDAGAGYAFEPQHPQTLADAVERLIGMTASERDHMGVSGQAYYWQKLSLEVGTNEFVRVFAQVATNKHSDRSRRLLDVIAAGGGLLVLGIPLAGLASLVRLKLGSPVLFSQQRPGLHGKPFTMYKFRTMREGIDSHGQPLPDSERLTPLGRFLRASSLDELPELFNVLRGDMSLVGPRPLLMEYLDRYTPQQSRRHEVRPGITGWAQINGRNAISWEEKFRLDVWYVENRSFALDMKILWMTVQKVFKRDGISAAGEATMPKFEGQGEM